MEPQKETSSGDSETSETTSRCLETTNCTEEHFTDGGLEESSDHEEPKYVLRQLSSKVKYEDSEDVLSTEGLGFNE